MPKMPMSPMRGAVKEASANHMVVPAKQGKLTGMRYDWEDKTTVVLEVDSGDRHSPSQSVRIPASQSENFKLGQTVKIETSVTGS